MTLQADGPPLSPGNHHDQDYDHDHNHHDHHHHDHVDDDSDDDNDDGNNVSFKEFSYQTRVHMDLGLVVKSQLKLFFIFLS